MKPSAASHIVTVALFAALCAVLSQISFLLPISEVPFSLGLFGAFLTGALLSPPLAVAAQSAYVLLGAVGAPVFAGFRGGLAVLLGPTGGYLLGYIVVAATVSLLAGGRRSPSRAARFAVMALSLLLHYTCGTVWLLLITHTTLSQALTLAVLPFFVPDLLKAAGAALITPLLQRAFKAARLPL